jgi:hypothetical protein
MSQTISQIHSLLDRLEGEIELTRESVSMQALSGLELPDILRDIIDLLFPHLTPYKLPFTCISSGILSLPVERRWCARVLGECKPG